MHLLIESKQTYAPIVRSATAVQLQFECVGYLGTKRCAAQYRDLHA